MATIGAPLAGAIESLFWTRQASIRDAWGDDTLASRQVVEGMGENWGLPEGFPGFRMRVWHRPDTGDTRMCDSKFSFNIHARDTINLAFERMYAAIIHDEQFWDKYEADSLATQIFVGIPPVLLGALRQCMQHSLLAGVCTAWARHHFESDRQAQTKVGALLLANAKIGDDQACILLDAGRNFLVHHGRMTPG